MSVSVSCYGKNCMDFVENIVKSDNKKKFAFYTLKTSKATTEALINYGKSIGGIFDRNFANNKMEVIINNAERILVSENQSEVIYLILNFLEDIFKRTDQSDRQQHFHMYLDAYYKILQEREAHLENLTVDDFEQLVKVLLPYIKLKIVIKQLQKTGYVENSTLQELHECISCPKLLREDCYQIIKNKIGPSKYDLLDFELIPFEENAGLLGTYFNLNITIKQDDIEKVLVFFAKYVPSTNDSLANLAFKVFKKEIFIYKEFIPKLKNLGVHDISNFAPAYAFSRANDVLVLENMSTRKFGTSKFLAPVEWLEMVMKKLSDFHACSLIFDEKLAENHNTTIGKMYKDVLKEMCFNKNEATGILAIVGTQTIIKHFLDKMSYVPKKISLEELKKRILSEFEKMFKSAEPSETYFNVICHRDTWAGNILTRKNSEKDFDSCVFIDFQMVTYSPPVVDLLFILYAHTDRTTRKKYMDELIRLYYRNLQHNLAKYEIDIDEICTYENFLKMVEQFKSIFILQALTYTQVHLCPGLEEIVKDEDKAKQFYFVERGEAMNQAWKCEVFKSRIGDLVEELCEVLEHK